MYLYVFKRLTLMIPTLLGAAALVFFLMRLIPGDICTLRLATGGGSINPGVVKACRLELGMDQPILLQFWLFIKGLLSFDFGRSMWTGRPIVEEVGAALPTFFAGRHHGHGDRSPDRHPARHHLGGQTEYLDRLSGARFLDRRRCHAVVLARHPHHFGILIASKALFGSPWMPPIKYVPIWVDPVYNLSMLIWPALATGYRYSAVATRMTRSAMLEVLREDYVRTARAKGVFRYLIVRRHALRNALLPVVTIIGIEFAFLMGGLVVTEQVFNLNGLGKLFVESVSNQDYTMTQALVMLVVTIFAFTNLIVDVIYAWLDPRIRYRR